MFELRRGRLAGKISDNCGGSGGWSASRTDCTKIAARHALAVAAASLAAAQSENTFYAFFML